MRSCLLWFCIFLQSTVFGQDTVVIADPLRLHGLAQHALYWEDTSGTFTISDLIQDSGVVQFQPVQKKVVNFGITPAVFWIKLAVHNATEKELLLKVGNYALNDLQVFEVVGHVVRKQYNASAQFPFAQREVKDIDFIFPLQVHTGDASTIYIRVQHNRGTQFPLLAGTLMACYNEAGRRNLLHGIYYGFMLLMILYNLFIYFSLRDSAYLYYVAYVFMMGLLNASITGYAFHHLWPQWPAVNLYEDILAAITCIAGILFTVTFLNTRNTTPFFHRVMQSLLIGYLIIGGIVASGNFFIGSVAVESLSLVLVVVFFITAYAVLRKGYKPAKFFLIAWSLLLVGVIIFVMKDFDILPYTMLTENSLQIGSALEALLLSMALANRINVYKKEKQKAELENMRSLEENRKLVTAQKMELEKQVEERTAELKNTNKELLTVLMNLRDAQAQLIQKEKMAYLGELTAGIAHEIKNPLNFVNNFSETNVELLTELKSEMRADHRQEAMELAEDILQNEEKINYHGKRADAIVQSMLQHTGSAASKKEPTDINTLAGQYLRLTYQRLKGKYNNFDVNMVTLFDDSIERLDVDSQDIGKVLLNLYNNAFYAMSEKKKNGDGQYQPTIEVRTGKVANKVTISVRDNGIGISNKVLDKIYQPFFTTKPAGEGSGLGLSLSYDIITKGYNGELRVETKEGEGTEFKIILPANSN